MLNSVYDAQVKTISGKMESLEVYKGKTLLIVNVASKCGFTSQYEGLEKLYEKYKNSGFEILGFPCNQFAGQEPLSDAEINEFCSLNFHVSFPMFSKIEVNGANAHPLFEYLKSQAKGVFGTESIKWNFTKFLVGADGNVLGRYAPAIKPEDLEHDIGKAVVANVKNI